MSTDFVSVDSSSLASAFDMQPIPGFVNFGYFCRRFLAADLNEVISTFLHGTELLAVSFVVQFNGSSRSKSLPMRVGNDRSAMR